MYNVLILGSGGREHAIAWSIYKDSQISDIYRRSISVYHQKN